VSHGRRLAHGGAQAEGPKGVFPASERRYVVITVTPHILHHMQ
jgi:hypothetical protein